jgi:hypothetical protein
MDIEPHLEGCLPARVIGMTGIRHKVVAARPLQLAECPDPCDVRQSDVTRNAAPIRLAGVDYLPGFNSWCRCE